MKTSSFIALILSSVALITHGQTAGNVGNATEPAPTPWTVVSRGANHNVWQRETFEPGPNGTTITNIHRYTELATGLNHLVNGRYLPSGDQIEVSPDGMTASATNCEHQVYFPGDVYSGDIKLVIPTGQVLESQPIGLALSDGSNSVLLAAVTNSTGAILPSGNEVIYTNAFSGLQADLLYKNTLAGMEQNVVLRQQPDFSSLGLNPKTTCLQMLTEFVACPQPGITTNTISTAVGQMEDDTLNFGSMALGRGKAFLLGTNSLTVGVEKHWLLLNGRQFLVEEVPMVSITNALDSLPRLASSAGIPKKVLVSRIQILPARRVSQKSPKTMFLAQAAPASNGLVLDYTVLDSGLSNFTFQGDTTYLVSNTVNLAGVTRFEGGTVIKCSFNGQINIDLSSAPVICDTAAYRPAVFTSMNDNSVGETINGSSGQPSLGDVNEFLSLGNSTASDVTLHDMRFSQAYNAIQDNDSTIDLWDCQFANVDEAIIGNNIGLHNVLISRPTDDSYNGAVLLYGGSQLNAENITEEGDPVDSQYGGFVEINVPGVTVALTNCLIVNHPIVASDMSGYAPAALLTNSTVCLPSPSVPVFQTTGAGSHYLTNDSPYRDFGTTNINPVLLAELRTKTTYPPIVYSNMTFTTNLVFSFQAPRDTNASPDIGYHYDPIDYAFGGVDVYSNITFNAGTVMGWFQLPGSGGPGYGITLHGHITVDFGGTATVPCISTRYDTVQEGSDGLWTDRGWLAGIASYQYNSYDVSIAPEILATFTRFYALDADPNHFRDYYTPLLAYARNCEFYAHGIGAYNNAYYFTNCLFDDILSGQIQGYSTNDAYILQNCTFHNGQLSLSPNYNPIPISVHDCSLDGTTLSVSSYGANSAYASYDYNAFTNGMARFPIGGTHDVTNLISFDWQNSWFGNFYLPTNSALLNVGDVPANQVGLYHFTIQTNQVIEGTNIVSIGYHYVAADAYGNSLDSNGDGIPDYLEDANGNGTYNTGDLGDWQGLNLNILITQPQNKSSLP